MQLVPIAHIHSDFPAKFGVPRQSGLVDELVATVVFVPQFRSLDAVRGLADFTHIWLLWGFSQVRQMGFAPTVRPPRLGGNTRVGVFASRSPNRPNPIGLSCVRLAGVEEHPTQGPLLQVRGADLVDGTPIYDIKPYLPYADRVPAAVGGFAEDAPAPLLRVEGQEHLAALPPEKQRALCAVLAQDPRPAYHNDPQRVYGMSFAGAEVKFSIKDDVLTIRELMP